jgi:hypothetical protein
MSVLLDKITLFPAWIYFQLVKSLEKDLGYRVELKNLPSDWIDGEMVFNMTPVWKKYGIDATGVNYFTVGGLKKDLSSRFDYQSPYYQSWLGGYIVKFKESRTWTIQDHFNLGEADQKNWLDLYGDPQPEGNIPRDGLKHMGQVIISGYKGQLYEGGGWSHSDVGEHARGFLLSAMMSACANIFNFSNSTLALSGKNFLPNWNCDSSLNSYHNVRLLGYIAILELDEKHKAVLYANATQFTDKHNKRYDYFGKLRPELKRILQTLEIVKV